jgi:hypothetical protein
MEPPDILVRTRADGLAANLRRRAAQVFDQLFV